MRFNPISDLAQRLIFPNGLSGRGGAHSSTAMQASVMKPRVGRDGLRIDSTDLPARKPQGLAVRLKRAKVPVVQSVPVEAAVKSASRAGAGPFWVRRTRHIDNGFELIGYPRWKGIPLPLRTRVQMRMGAGSDGSWALWPEAVSVWGVKSSQLREAVSKALRAESKLSPDGDRFRILIQ